MMQRFLPDDEKRRRALVVGVDTAPDARDPKLKKSSLHAAEDAQDMAEALHAYTSGFELVEPVLTNADATSARIKAALERMEQESTKDDFLLFYFSGHGHFLRRLPTENQPDRVHMYLVSHDFSEEMGEQDENRFLSLAWLRQYFYTSPRAGKILIILDCCYAGYFTRASTAFAENFEAPTERSHSLTNGFRKALGAVGHLETARDGRMTFHLVRALRGKVDEVIETSIPNDHDDIRLGHVLYSKVYHYLETAMPRDQRPSDSGDSAGRLAILARHEERARQILRSQRPHSFLKEIPYDYHHRPDELGGQGRLLKMLEEQKATERPILGLIGQPYIGKTWLAKMLADICNKRNMYPDGIFWLDCDSDDNERLLQKLAEIARKVEYLPLNNTKNASENTRALAEHLCYYLATHKDALLILDNVTQRELITKKLPELARVRFQCTIIYTARERLISEKPAHEVLPFPLEIAMVALLHDVRPHVLQDYQSKKSDDEEVKAARAICQMVEGLPHNLSALHTLLQDTQRLSLQDLHRLLKEKNSELPDLELPLRESWEQIQGEGFQNLFLLAVLFPEADSIPAWLLKVAAGLREHFGTRSIERALQDLAYLGWIERDLENATQKQQEQFVRIHPRRRDFGLRILANEPERVSQLRVEAAGRLVAEFFNLSTLYKRTISPGSYVHCQEQVRIARSYAHVLNEECEQSLAKVERWLDRESAFLMEVQENLFRILFYQQLYNRAIEEGDELSGKEPECWLKLEEPIGVEDQALLRVLAGHKNHVRCLAVTPDGQYTLTGSNDATARIWESATGKLVTTFTKHTAHVLCATFSPDNLYALTGAEDEVVHIWDYQTGQLHKTLTGHSGAIYSVICSPDGKYIITGSSDHNVCIWDFNDGTLVKSWHFSSYIQALCARRDEVLIACATTLWEWHYLQEEPPRLLQHGDRVIAGLALDPKQRYLAVGIQNPPRVDIWVWDDKQRFLLHTLVGHTHSLNSIAFSPQGTWLATGADDETARLWNYMQGTCKAHIMGHSGCITSVVFFQEKHLITGSINNTARVWDIPTALAMHSEHNARTEGIKQAFDSRDADQYLLSVFNWQAEISPDGRYVILFGTKRVEIWETEQRKCVNIFEAPQIKYIAFLAEASSYFFVVRYEGLELHMCQDGALFNEEGREQYEDYFRQRYDETTLCQRSPQTKSVSITTPNKKFRIESTQENFLAFWDLTAPLRKDSHWQEPHDIGQATYLSFSPDGQIFVVGNMNGYVSFFEWNERTRPIGKLAGKYQAPGQIVAIRWLDEKSIMIVDASSAGHPPHFHRLKLEGNWTRTMILQ